MTRVAVLAAPYQTRSATGADLALLDRNEGPVPPPELLQALASLDAGPELLRRYPDSRPLEAQLAARLGIGADRVLVTAGADDAIDRCCRAFLGEGRRIVFPTPTFQMLERYAALAGGVAVTVAWTGSAFPLTEVLARLDDATSLVAIISPNNPTGAAIGPETLVRVAQATKAIVLLDHAYVEYADRDLTATALAIPNVVVVRTLSKAWGLAGCRLGYAVGSPDVINTLRAAGAPYPAAAPSLALAVARLATGSEDVREHVSQVRGERARLAELLAGWGVTVCPSQASFVLADFGARARFVHQALLAKRVVVRNFSTRPDLEGSLRITLPGEETLFRRLVDAFELILAPEAVLFDLDGVLADVRESYDACIAATAASFGVTVTHLDIAAARQAGDANNDWLLTQRLVHAGGARAPLETVRARFQACYAGEYGGAGLRDRERLVPPASVLHRLARRFRLGVVTGRPREEAERFLERHGIADAFAAVVTMGEAPAKPAPEPVRLALERLGVRRAWLVGDTPDDMRSAGRAGVLPIGVVPPGGSPAPWVTTLHGAGAAWTLTEVDALAELLP